MSALFAIPLLTLACQGSVDVGTPASIFAPAAVVAQGQEAGKSQGGKEGQEGEKAKPEAGSKAKDGDKAKDGEAKDNKEHAEGAWLTDHAQAMELAKKAKKPVLVVFTGSDWCPPCKQLHDTVFASDAFKKWAKKSVVLLELDFPRSKELPPELKEQNQKLQEQYKVDGYPTVMALDAKGKKLFEQSGFGGDSPEQWIKKFDKTLAKKK